MAVLCLWFHEIYLITNRYLTAKNKNNWIIKLKLKYYIPILIIFPLAFSLPIYFSFTIKLSNENRELYNWTLSDLSETYAYRAYFLLGVVVENIIPLIILVTMNIQSLRNIKKLDNCYTRITIIITTLFIITRVTDFVSGLSSRAAVFFIPSSEILTISVINLIRQLALFFLSRDAFIQRTFVCADW